MKVDLFIAWRYLFAKKSHNVINVISAISSIGMAVGAAALILILSVYNGFDRIIENNMSDLEPDILVSPAEGKYFIPESDTLNALLEDSRIKSISSVIEENVFISYDGRQGVARAKGVDEIYEKESPIAGHLTEGQFILRDGDLKFAAVGASLASEMQIRVAFLSPLTVYYPRRGAGISLTSPVSSLASVSMRPSSIFSITTDIDNSLIILPLESMQTLTGAEDGAVTGLEIRLDGSDNKHAIKDIRKTLGDSYLVLDRYQQNPSLYKMMRYEKLAIFMILLFVVIIIAFNIFGSLSMLIIEKKDDIATLKAMGASDRLAKRIFVLEGWLVSLVGLMAGVAIGILLALVQQHFGIIKMPGGFLLQAYPVVLKAADVILTTAGVALIGFAISLLAVGRES